MPGFSFFTRFIVFSLSEITICVEYFTIFIIQYDYIKARLCFRTHGGVIQDKNYPNFVTAPVLMWVKALDMLMDRLLLEGVDFSQISGVSGTAQVCINRK